MVFFVRGEIGSSLLAFAEEYRNTVKACVARPGYLTVTGPYLKTVEATVMALVRVVPKIDMREVSTAIVY